MEKPIIVTFPVFFVINNADTYKYTDIESTNPIFTKSIANWAILIVCVFGLKGYKAALTNVRMTPEIKLSWTLLVLFKSLVIMIPYAHKTCSKNKTPHSIILKTIVDYS